MQRPPAIVLLLLTATALLSLADAQPTSATANAVVPAAERSLQPVSSTDLLTAEGPVRLVEVAEDGSKLRVTDQGMKLLRS